MSPSTQTRTNKTVRIQLGPLQRLRLCEGLRSPAARRVPPPSQCPIFDSVACEARLLLFRGRPQEDLEKRVTLDLSEPECWARLAVTVVKHVRCCCSPSMLEQGQSTRTRTQHGQISLRDNAVIVRLAASKSARRWWSSSLQAVELHCRIKIIAKPRCYRTPTVNLTFFMISTRAYVKGGASAPSWRLR